MKNSLLDFVDKYKTFLLLSAIALVVFNKYIVMILLLIVFGILGISSLKVSRLVPHISIETITASSVLLGYAYGWKIALGFGIFFGLYGYTMISMIKLKSIINALLMGLCGVIASIFASMNYSFFAAYMLTFIVRIVLNMLIFPLVEPDQFENMIHGFGDPIFSMLITFQFMNILFNLISLIH